MLSLSQIACKDKFFFAFTGPKNFNDLNPAQITEAETYIASQPENCLFHLDFLKEGAEFNAVFSSFDIVFLVYNNFASSSNRLTKASIFKKYAIAPNRFCVGEDVEKYKLGRTVPENDPKEALKAIEILASKIKNNDFSEAQFEYYAQLHSVETLAEKFVAVLDSVQ